MLECGDPGNERIERRRFKCTMSAAWVWSSESRSEPEHATRSTTSIITTSVIAPVM
jgi:hypothetical protein